MGLYRKLLSLRNEVRKEKYDLMGTIDLLFETDVIRWVYITLVVLSGLTAILVVIEKFFSFIGKPIKWFNRNSKDHELLLTTSKMLQELQAKQNEDVKQSIRHDEIIKEDLSKLSETVEEIASTLNDMKEKDNITEVKKLKEKLVGYYNKYKNSDGWTTVEKDVFWDLFEEYENRGGDGYIHSIVEPVMRELKVVD